jgi:hypothetical protein
MNDSRAPLDYVQIYCSKKPDTGPGPVAVVFFGIVSALAVLSCILFLFSL